MADLQVRLIPRAGREEIAGERDGRIVVRVTAPPVEGRANAALCRLLARQARVGLRRVSIVRGQSSRDKVVRVEGIDDAALRSRLGL
jgi:uncharacterized protein